MKDSERAFSRFREITGIALEQSQNKFGRLVKGEPLQTRRSDVLDAVAKAYENHLSRLDSQRELLQIDKKYSKNNRMEIPPDPVQRDFTFKALIARERAHTLTQEQADLLAAMREAKIQNSQAMPADKLGSTMADDKKLMQNIERNRQEKRAARGGRGGSTG